MVQNPSKRSNGNIQDTLFSLIVPQGGKGARGQGGKGFEVDY